MSRTDVHRPYDVQAEDPTCRHRFYRFQVRGDTHELISLRNLCGCRLCIRQHSRKYTRRRERAEWRAHARAWLKGAEPRPPKNLETW